MENQLHSTSFIVIKYKALIKGKVGFWIRKDFLTGQLTLSLWNCCWPCAGAEEAGGWWGAGPTVDP